MCDYKKKYDNKFFSPLSFVTVFGSGILDPGSGIPDPGRVKIRIRDPGSGINIPDPQHCLHDTVMNLWYGSRSFLFRIKIRSSSF